MKKDLRRMLEDTYAGSATAPDIWNFAEEHGFDETDVAETLDDLEIYQCTSCGWWLHPGEIYLGHADECEGHEEMICGDCCT